MPLSRGGVVITSPPVTSPPRNPYRSISRTRAPFRAAHTAAATPANPPPQTRTSASAATGILRSGSTMKLIGFLLAPAMPNAWLHGAPQQESLRTSFGHDFLQDLQDGPSLEDDLITLVAAGHRQVNSVAREHDLLDRCLRRQRVAEAHRCGEVEMQLPYDRGAYAGSLER